VLDGHIVLSRRIAESGRYPAVDVEASVSRVMSAIVSREQRELVQTFRQIGACYERHRDLISVGAYRRGSDPQVDRAIALYAPMQRFLHQLPEEAVGFDASLEALRLLLADSGPTERQENVT
jgi:flagellum-specific ATP synthase